MIFLVERGRGGEGMAGCIYPGPWWQTTREREREKKNATTGIQQFTTPLCYTAYPALQIAPPFFLL